jgi:hypothetical protein
MSLLMLSHSLNPPPTLPSTKTPVEKQRKTKCFVRCSVTEELRRENPNLSAPERRSGEVVMSNKPPRVPDKPTPKMSSCADFQGLPSQY